MTQISTYGRFTHNGLYYTMGSLTLGNLNLLYSVVNVPAFTLEEDTFLSFKAVCYTNILGKKSGTKDPSVLLLVRYAEMREAHGEWLPNNVVRIITNRSS